jgi:hypothetical protein
MTNRDRMLNELRHEEVIELEILGHSDWLEEEEDDELEELEDDDELEELEDDELEEEY